MRAVLLLTFALLGCATDAPDSGAADAVTVTGGTVEMRIIATGSQAAVEPEAPQAVAIRTAGEYPGVWETTVGGGQPHQVDFDSESVVILLAGSRRTGGYSVEPRGARLEGRTLVVDAAVISPAPGAIVTMAFTSPYAAIAVKAKSFDDVRWKP